MSAEIFNYLKMAAPEDPDTWFSIHRRTFIPGKDEPIFPGNAHKTIRHAYDDVKYWVARGHCVYLSQGMFRTAGAQIGLYNRAERSYPNLVGCRNLYMDVDVKPDGYQSSAEAIGAIRGFITGMKLPPPTIIVGSGSGGFHVYWTLDTVIDRAEHAKLAGKLIAAGDEYGLKFDRQCTRDATRLLRVGGTWNQKFADPANGIAATPVKTIYLGKEHLDAERMRKALESFKEIKVTPQSNLRVVGGTDARGLPLDELNLDGGKRDYPPTKIDEVAQHCPFIKSTLEQGGANLVGDPQWHLAVSLACHCEDPRETAHRLCRQSQYYSEEGTDAKLATAQLAREQRSTIGPPKCATIASEREECKACPHLARNTTPLAVGFVGGPNIAGKAKLRLVPPSHVTGELPYPYYRGTDDLIYMTVADKGDASPDGVLVFEYQLIPGSARVESGKPFQFVFDTIQGERIVTKKFDTSFASDNASVSRALSAEGMPITIKLDLTRQFMASYIKLLQGSDETLTTVPAFGWAQDKDGVWGFAYAGEFVTPSAIVRCTTPPEGTDNYRVMGDVQPWKDLVEKIVTKDRPDVACMVASSFGAPLVSMTGQAGLLLGLVSTSSGIGKSTALIAGQTVWSSPVVGGLSDTVVYTFSKLTTLRHLPVYYDEIKGEQQIKNMTQIAFQLTGGHEKGRADRSGKMKKVNEFRTLCGYAANGSVVDGVRAEDKGTDASWLRMFEMKAITLPKPDQPDLKFEVNKLLIELHTNHGGIGRQYATFLGRNHATISQGLANMIQRVLTDLNADPQVERFWVAAVATTLLGAILANKIGATKFDIAGMREFMYSQFRRIKQEMLDDPSDLNQDSAFFDAMGSFINDRFPKNTVVLDKTWNQPGKPPKAFAIIKNDRADHLFGVLEVQISGGPLTLRVTDKSLSDWCKRINTQKSLLVEQMKAKLKAKKSFGTIGSGSRLAGARENIWTIDAKGTIIEQYLEQTVSFGVLP